VTAPSIPAYAGQVAFIVEHPRTSIGSSFTVMLSLALVIGLAWACWWFLSPASVPAAGQLTTRSGVVKEAQVIGGDVVFQFEGAPEEYRYVGPHLEQVRRAVRPGGFVSVFPKFDGRHTLRKAALAAGLDPERASKVSAYDLRHSLATELTERSGNLVGVGYLLGHKHVTTTNHYVHARRRAAESVLSGHQGEERPNQESSGVAQLPGIKGCGKRTRVLLEYDGRSGRSPRSCRILGAVRKPQRG